jgi:argininosuccinate synthase
MSQKIVLAYSGGLDTSVAIPWLAEKYGAEIVTLTMDLGGGKSLEGVGDRALKTGATKAIVLDGREEFVANFVWPALQAGAIYEGIYPLATALARPLIAQHLVRVALEEQAFAVAHGCTGKGNDQVRFDVSTAALAPQLQVIAPARHWGMTRDMEVAYVREHGIPLELGARSPYSIDENLWGRSIEAGDLEDPWHEPPEEAYAWTKPVAQAPEQPRYVELDFQQGIPTAIDGEELGGVLLIQRLHALAGEHGIGRMDQIENRLVGIKSREVYEAPAAVVLHQAHHALEAMCLTKDQARFKERMAQEYADLVYNGLWFAQHRVDLNAYVSSTQRHVSGTIRLRLHKGTCTVVGRRSALSLYRHELATYDQGDQFDHQAAEGFIQVYGLPVRIQSQVQGQGAALDPLAGSQT